MTAKPNSRIAISLLVLMVLLSSCSTAPSDDTEENGTTPKEENVTIAYLPSGMTSPFYSEAAQGAAQVGARYGMKLEAQAPPAETDFNGQVAIFENFISKEVNGILFCAIDNGVLVPSIKKANREGIPLIVFNSLTPQEGGHIAGYVGYNQYKAGYTVGQYTGKKLNGRGKVYVIRGVPGYHDTLRVNGFYDALQEYPGITVVGEQVGDWVRDKSINIATEVLQNHPGIDMILGVNDEMAIGASIAARRLGKDIITVGIDGNANSVEEIEKGNLTATLGAFPNKIGETAMEQMRKILSGETIVPYLETPGVIVDKNNVEDYKTGKLWTGAKVAGPELLN